jgi:hypothetical protein
MSTGDTVEQKAIYDRPRPGSWVRGDSSCKAATILGAETVASQVVNQKESRLDTFANAGNFSNIIVVGAVARGAVARDVCKRNN